MRIEKKSSQVMRAKCFRALTEACQIFSHPWNTAHLRSPPPRDASTLSASTSCQEADSEGEASGKPLALCFNVESGGGVQLSVLLHLSKDRAQVVLPFQG